uniref:T-cell activation inhibitor, mitochondrial n=1 Tax=Globodera pallida TaxID=36090 RepID=A0A183BYG3_GLOPA
MTAHQASVALRPFYFAVHPDRFAREPNVRNGNEKALQVFNGYLNSLFPRPVVCQTPVQIDFMVRDKDDNKLKRIRISLSGVDVEQIVRTTLELCDLSTENLPTKSKGATDEPSSSTKWSAYGLDERARFAAAGQPSIIWLINWDQSHMRRCLMNVQSMMADQEAKEDVIHALNGRKLIFGRGSHVCCDGSLQFGADDATGAWQKVCVESGVRRFDVRNLELLMERARELLDGVLLIRRPHENVLSAIQQMQIFIGKICSQPKNEREILKGLLSSDIAMEVVNCYQELMVVEGCLQIPCCVEFQPLKKFIAANAIRSRQLRQEHFERKWQLELVKDACVKALALSELTWDDSLPFETLRVCMEKLRRIGPEKAVEFTQLSIHLSNSPKIFVMFNGRLSVPIGWIKEL